MPNTSLSYYKKMERPHLEAHSKSSENFNITLLDLSQRFGKDFQFKEEIKEKPQPKPLPQYLRRSLKSFLQEKKNSRRTIFKNAMLSKIEAMNTRSPDSIPDSAFDTQLVETTTTVQFTNESQNPMDNF